MSRGSNSTAGIYKNETALVFNLISFLFVEIIFIFKKTLMSSKKVADTQTAMQGETNRAADFINDENSRTHLLD